jgi:hypothetical protein
MMCLVGCPTTGGGVRYYPQNCANKPPVHTLQTLDRFKRPRASALHSRNTSGTQHNVL